MSESEVKYTDEGRVKLYVGSLPFDTRPPDLQEMFSKYGNCCNGEYFSIFRLLLCFACLSIKFFKFRLL